MSYRTATTVLSLLASASLLLAAGGGEAGAIPDFTKGGTIPEKAKHDWNLGATGVRGWMFADKLETTQARQIAVTQVAPGSPADGKFVVGDVILGVAGQRFSHDPRVELGKALGAAESEAGKGTLALTRWRGGNEEEVVLELKVLGTYSRTAPYDCPKSARILEEGCKALAARMQQEDYPKSQNAITRSLNALALLSGGNPEYMPLIRREVEWANQFSSDAFQTWWNAYVIMLLAEYKIATGDEAYAAGMNRLALEAAKGQSLVGSWGHGYALPSGILSGYGMMNAPGVPLTIALISAREAGLKDPAVDLAIERSAKLLRFYIGKGSIPYGDHHPWTQNHDDNGKNGMAGVMFNMLGEKDGAEFFSRMSVASHGSERDCGHTGNFTNLLWAMPGVALSGAEATGAWMNEFGGRFFDLTRTWDFRFPHPGAPEPDGDSYRGWDATGGYLLAYAMPLKKLMLTGKQPNSAPQIDAATANSLIADGRGWSNNDRYSAYDKLDPDTLLEKLGSWSPTVRERASIAIARRQGDKPIAAMVGLLDSPSLYARYGACEVLIRLKAAAAPAVPKLTALLNHEDLWMRVKAAEALSHIGAPAMPSLPILLERLAQEPGKSDPRGMEQRYLCFSIFEHMLRNSLDGVDRALLNKAVAAGLRNEDGRARSSIASVYKMLSYEEIKPLLPAILDAAAKPAPSGEMFADGIRLAGLEVLAAHHVAEGIPACTFYLLNQNIWASQIRTPEILKILVSYGAHAKSAIPELKQAAEMFDKGQKGFPQHMTIQKAADVRKAIAEIEAATEVPELRSIR
jgi:Family of unknown function (DUF6288)